MIRVEQRPENGWLSNIVMGYGIRTYIFQNYWIWQLVLDGVGLYEANDLGCQSITVLFDSCLCSSCIILLNETFCLKLACIEGGS